MEKVNIENMEQELEQVQDNVAVQTFSKLIRENINGIFCFCEGKDFRYYQFRVELICDKKAQNVPCGNKKTVLDTYKMIKNRREYDKYQTAFFVDRDFDPPISNPDIYETPCYAIENFYCNTDCFSNILKTEFGLTEIDDDYKNAMSHFRTRLDGFNQAVLLVNAWYACAKEARLASSVPLEIPNIDKRFKVVNDKRFKEKSYLNMSFESITATYTLNDIQHESDVFKVENEKLDAKKQYFQTIPSKECVFRGKFQMRFLTFYLHNLAADANLKTPTIFKSKRKNTMKVKMEVEADNVELALSDWANYAITPNCLRRYLEAFS